MIRKSGSIKLSTPPGGPHFARTSKTIEKVKHKLNQQMVSVRSWAKDYNISKSSAHRILKDTLKVCAYKMRIEPKLTEEHKNKRKELVNWVGYNFRKEDTMRILFSDEEMKQMKKVASKRNRNFPKRSWSGLAFVSKE